MSETQTKHPLADLMSLYTDSEGLPLMNESRDWEQIDAALTEWANRIPLSDDALGRMLPWFLMLRAVIQVVYLLGYRRGKRAVMPQFIVAENQEQR